MSSPQDRWYFDESDKLVAGVIIHDGEQLVVGDVRYVPQKFGGEGLGRLQARQYGGCHLDDYEPPTLEQIFNPQA